MSVAGIIAEYNPFHKGHEWQMAEARRRLGADTAIVCAMSGNWVQRGDAALLEKHLRAAQAVRGGADLVLELPLTWAVSSAERFARGGVEVLSAAGVVDTLVFGSETGDLAALERRAAFLQTEEYAGLLRDRLKTGCSFASARQQALDTLNLPRLNTAENPNDQLGMEYLKALTGTGIRPLPVLRRGVGHHGARSEDGFASASWIRAQVRKGADVSDCLPGGLQDWTEGDTALLERAERGVLSVVRRMTAADFARLPDCSDGLENRMAEAVRQGCSLSEICDRAKTKRYAYARLRRLLIWSYLGLSGEDFEAHVPYLRVLAFSQRGQALLGQMRSAAALPVVVKPASVRKLGGEARRLMELESRATDLWQLCRIHPAPCGGEYSGLCPVPLQAF